MMELQIGDCNCNNASSPTPTPNYDQDYFVTTWKADYNRIEIPTNKNYSYNYRIDWGDGKIDTNVTGDIAHTVTHPIEVYTVRYMESFSNIFGNMASSLLKIIWKKIPFR